MKYSVYTKPNCKWCIRAKNLLADKGLEYTEYVYQKDFSREDLIEKLKRNWNLTLPQIYLSDNVKEIYIGSYEDLEKHLNVSYN